MSDYPMLISNKLHSFRNFMLQKYAFFLNAASFVWPFLCCRGSFLYFCLHKHDEDDYPIIILYVYHEKT